MKITNRANLPEGLVRAIQNDPYNSAGADVTASTLADPPLLQALKRKHENELEEDASERVWALFGQAMHVVMERGALKVPKLTGDHLENDINLIASVVEGAEELIASGEVLVEKRLSMDVLGWKLSGALDHFTIEKGVLSDYKCISAWTLVYGDRIADWEKQQNVLAHLLEVVGGYKVTTLEIIAILRDWSQRDVERVKNYPPVNVATVPLKLWPKEKRQSYIEARVEMHQAARGLVEQGNAHMVPPCTDDERWAKTDRKGVKTYVRCGSAEKPGYCPVAKFCPQLAKERAAA